MESIAKQLIDGTGNFDAEILEDFMKTTKMDECDMSYVVVAIMGPQSSGKSTLLNATFGTNFVEMKAADGRNQTTLGIWMAKCVGVVPPTIIFDVEGTDGKERSQAEDLSFERKTTLFALATSDILLINMWCNDIGRDNGANVPLMKTVFQVMVDSFVTSRKRTLMFIIRDTTLRTTLTVLDKQLRDLMDTIWESVKKPEEQKNKLLSDYFDVEVVALSHYEYRHDEFLKEIVQLRQRFSNSTSPGGLASDRRDVVPAKSFAYSTQQLWNTIKQNKKLDLPAHKVLVATFRCEEIANENYTNFTADKDVLKLVKEIEGGDKDNVGMDLSKILEIYLSEYDKHASQFDVEDVKNNKRKQFESKALEFFYPTMTKMLRNLSSKSFENFKTMLENSLQKGEGFESSARSCIEACMDTFDNRCNDAMTKGKNWDAPDIKEKLQNEMDAHKSFVRHQRLTGLVATYENNLSREIEEGLETLFKACKADTWRAVRNHIDHVKRDTKSKFLSAVDGYEFEGEEVLNMVQNLMVYAVNLVENVARAKAGEVSTIMEKRFTQVFSRWTVGGDIVEFTTKALLESVQLLSIMAAIRWEDIPDNIEDVLISSLIHNTGSPLTTMTWVEFPIEATLIAPVECDSLWTEFLASIQYLIRQSENMAQLQSEKDSEIEELKKQIEEKGSSSNTTQFVDFVIGVTNGLLNPVEVGRALRQKQ